MKKQQRFLLLGLLGLLALGLLLFFLLPRGGGKKSMGTDSPGDGKYLLTVDGYGVTEAEFLLFLSDKKAVTANYFWTKHKLQPDGDFWSKTVDGERPIDYAKGLALDALVQSKVMFLLAGERDVLEYKDYNAMMADMAAENADRAKKRAAGEIFYGVTEFNPFTYYSYLNTGLRAELEKNQREVFKPSDADLKRVYEAQKEIFSKGTVYEYEVVYADGTRETITQSDREIGKEDYTTEDLIARFQAMQPGEALRGYDLRGRHADIFLRAKNPQGYVPFGDAKEDLRTLHARQTLTELLEFRAKGAKVALDQARYDAITMP